MEFTFTVEHPCRTAVLDSQFIRVMIIPVGETVDTQQVQFSLTVDSTDQNLDCGPISLVISNDDLGIVSVIQATTNGLILTATIEASSNDPGLTGTYSLNAIVILD